MREEVLQRESIALCSAQKWALDGLTAAFSELRDSPSEEFRSTLFRVVDSLLSQLKKLQVLSDEKVVSSFANAILARRDAAMGSPKEDTLRRLMPDLRKTSFLSSNLFAGTPTDLVDKVESSRQRALLQKAVGAMTQPHQSRQPSRPQRSQGKVSSALKDAYSKSSSFRRGGASSRGRSHPYSSSSTENHSRRPPPPPAPHSRRGKSASRGKSSSAPSRK